MLDHLGPIVALQNYLKTYTERTGIAVELENAANIEGLDPQRGTVLYRVAQESLTNVFKHAEATRVRIRLRNEADHLCMEIADNGRGAARRPRSDGDAGEQRLGLIGMQERVRLVDGQFTIDSPPRRGTTVRVQIPLSSKHPMGRRTTLSTPGPAEPPHHTSHEQNQSAPCR